MVSLVFCTVPAVGRLELSQPTEILAKAWWKPKQFKDVQAPVDFILAEYCHFVQLVQTEKEAKDAKTETK